MRATHALPDWHALARSWWALGLLVVAVAVAWLPVVDFGWVFDDHRQIVENARLADWGGLRHAFTDTLWSFDAARPEDPRRTYRPLFVVYLTLGRTTFGVDPAGWHVTGVVLHAIACGIVWRLGLRLGLGPFPALAAGLVFALHPAQIQAVTWISAVTDPLQTIALGLSLHAWLRALDGEGSTAWAAAAAIGLAAGMLCIERAFVFVGVLGLAALLLPEGFAAAHVRRRIRLAAPLAVAVAAVLGIRMLATGHAAQTASAISGLEALWTAPALAFHYAQIVVAPLQLSLGYDVGVTPELSVGAVLVPAAVVAAALVASFLASRRSPRRLFLLGSFVVLMAPALHAQLLHPHLLVQDRYLYLPAAFLFMWIADVVFTSDVRLPRIVGGVWLLALLVLHRPNLEPWRDDLSLYSRAVEVAPGHPTFAMNLSNERRRRGLADPECALLHAAKDSLGSRAWRGTTVEVDYNLGNCWRDLGDFGRARDHYLAAVRDSDGRLLHPLYNLAALQLDMGDLAAAEQTLARMHARHEAHAATWRLEGILAARRGQTTAARQAFERALELDPHDQASRSMLARL